MEAPDRRSPLPPMKGRTIFTSIPYPGFEPGTFGVAVTYNKIEREYMWNMFYAMYTVIHVTYYICT